MLVEEDLEVKSFITSNRALSCCCIARWRSSIAERQVITLLRLSLLESEGVVFGNSDDFLSSVLWTVSFLDSVLTAVERGAVVPVMTVVFGCGDIVPDGADDDATRLVSLRL